MEAYSLLELNEYIKQVIALNFEAPVWIQCEISQIKSSRGNYYLDLVQKDENTDQVVAQSSAALWNRGYWFIRKKLGDIVDELLQDGIEIKLKVKVDFHERYGLKLVIEDIDPSYTLGQLEVNRRKIIERLEKEKLLELNTTLPLPSVLQRIAILSSGRAAGYQDFISHLDNNPYNYDYYYELFDIAVQGAKVESDLKKQLSLINSRAEDFDCIVIIRGGGARLDLAAFDSYEIGKAIALSKMPVLVGIGHDIDTTVADLTAHGSLKTPTAVSDFIIDHNLSFERDLNYTAQKLNYTVKQMLFQAKEELIRLNTYIKSIPGERLVQERSKLDHFWPLISAQVSGRIQSQKQSLKHFQTLLKALDPEEILSKGYSITLHNGKPVLNANDINTGDIIETKVNSGFIESEVKNISE